MNILRVLKQKAVYWPPTAAGEDGSPTTAVPVEVKCRWEDKQELQLEPGSNESWVSQAVVYVNRRLEVEGLLWLGAYTNLTSRTDPYANKGASKIRKYNEIPDRKATSKGTLRIATL